MSRTEVRVELPGREYAVHIEAGSLAVVGEIVPPPAPGQAAGVIADETTGRLFGPRVLAGLEAADWRPHLLTVPPGEGSKTLAVAADLYARLAECGLDRASTVFALGGGVVGDLGGFVAATYLRGIDFVTLPTTLLAQVDSSVGGKVGVDLPCAKNLVGAFHQPRAVVIDPQTLASLPEREYGAGLAEVVKHAAIADAGLFAQLTGAADRVRARDPALMTDIVASNCLIKARVVVQDPEERSGVRAVLNFGHTIGHAVERGAIGWGLLHGEAVAVGMVAEARVAARLGLSEPQVPAQLAELLGELGVPTHAPHGGFDVPCALRALCADKKIVRGRLRLPVVPRIGEVALSEAVSIDELAAELSQLPGY